MRFFAGLFKSFASEERTLLDAKDCRTQYIKAALLENICIATFTILNYFLEILGRFCETNFK
jgi:hypothetical protein